MRCGASEGAAGAASLVVAYVVIIEGEPAEHVGEREGGEPAE